jgi:hypothetical protein
METRRVVALAAIAIAATFLMATPSRAQSAPASPIPGDPNEPAGFKIAYGLSFALYDACDDSEAGQIFRRAVLEKFEKCQFPQEVRAKFRDWLIENLEEIATSGWRAAAERKDVTPSPDLLSVDGSIKTCKAYRETSAYLEKRTILLKYDRKQIGVDAVVGSECSLGPAAL